MTLTLAGLWGLASAWRVLTTGKHPSPEVSSALTVPSNALQWISGWNDSAQSQFSTSKGYTVFRMPAPPSIFWKVWGGVCCRDRGCVEDHSCTTFWYLQSVFHKWKNSLSVPALYVCIFSFRTSTHVFLWVPPCIYVWFVLSFCLNCKCFRAAIISPSVSW